MYKNLLPIGSVVLLRGGEKRLMICGRIQTRAGSDKVYDYSACLYPEGITGPAGMYFFDREAVETVFFLGFQDKEELDWRANVLDKLGEVEVRDGKMFIEPYEYHDCDAAFTCSADLLFKLAAGKADPVASVLMGKLKVEGSIDKAMQIKTFLAAHRG